MQDDKDKAAQNNEDSTLKQNTEDVPKWQPDPVKYDCDGGKMQNPQNPHMTIGTGMTIFIVVISVIVAFIVVCLIIGISYVRDMKQTEGIYYIQNTETEMQDDTLAGGETDLNGGGIVLTDVSDIVDEAMSSVVSVTSKSLVSTGDFYNYYYGYITDETETAKAAGESQQTDKAGASDNAGQQTDKTGTSDTAGQVTDRTDTASEGNQETVKAQSDIISGAGSGTIVNINKDEVLILTSFKVASKDSSFAVTFADGKSADGVLKSADADMDLAVISVPADDIKDDTMSAIHAVTISYEPAEKGEGVVVIGNPLGYGANVSAGVVSAADRQISVDGKNITVIQTDAVINKGNTGGCMLNKNGELIGISEAEIAINGGEGMDFAISVSANAELIQKLLKSNNADEYVENTTNAATGAYLGIRGRDIDSELSDEYGMPMGVYVADVIEGSGAEKAGLYEGDIITAIDRISVSSMETMQEVLSKYNVGDVATIKIQRISEGEYVEKTIKITLTDQIG